MGRNRQNIRHRHRHPARNHLRGRMVDRLEKGTCTRRVNHCMRACAQRPGTTGRVRPRTVCAASIGSETRPNSWVWRRTCRSSKAYSQKWALGRNLGDLARCELERHPHRTAHSMIVRPRSQIFPNSVLWFSHLVLPNPICSGSIDVIPAVFCIRSNTRSLCLQPNSTDVDSASRTRHTFT
jgi:hypothetical protein